MVLNSPDILLQIISKQFYAGSDVDVWSCGVVLYALLCGRLPFEAENLSYLCTKIKVQDKDQVLVFKLCLYKYACITSFSC